MDFFEVMDTVITVLWVGITLLFASAYLYVKVTMERSEKVEALREDIWRALFSGMVLDDIQILLTHKYKEDLSPMVVADNLQYICMKDFCTDNLILE